MSYATLIGRLARKLRASSMVDLLRAAFLFLSAATGHAVAMVAAISPNALPYLDATAFTSISLTFYGTLLLAVGAGIMFDQLAGAEFPYKRHYRDKKYGRKIARKSAYVRENDDESSLLIPLMAFLAFITFYLSSARGIFVLSLPFLFLFFVYGAPRFSTVLVPPRRRAWSEAGGRASAVALLRPDGRGAAAFTLGFFCLAA